MLRLVLSGTFLFILTLPADAQLKNSNEINSLQVQLQNSKADSNKINLLHSLSDAYLSRTDAVRNYETTSVDSCILSLKQAVKLGDSLHLIPKRNESYVKLARAYVAQNDMKQATATFMILIKYYQDNGDKKMEAETWRLAGSYTPKRKEYYSTIHNFLQNALLLYQQLNDKEKEADIRIKIANVHMYEGKLNIAEKELLAVLDFYHTINFKKTYNTYYLLSVNNRYKGDLDKSLLYARKCVENMEETKDTLNAAFFYGELAQVYEGLGYVEESIEWYKKTLQKREEKKSGKIVIYRTVGYILKQLNLQGKQKEAFALIQEIASKYPPVFALEKGTFAQNMANYYASVKQYPVAEKYYLESLDAYEKVGLEDEYRSMAYEDVGNFYLQQKEYDKARLYLLNAIDVPAGTNLLTREKDIQLKLFIADSASGNYLSAIQHLRQHKILNDSIFNEKKSQQIEELQVQYQTAEKEKEIIQLNDQSRAQRNQLAKSALIRNIIIACILLLAGFIFYRYKLKQKSNKKLEAQQKVINEKNASLQRLVEEKEWLVREIHHRVKNNFHTVMGLLATQSEYLKTAEAINAMTESRNRIQAMSLIHQKLYQSDDLSAINMSDYIHELVAFLRNSFDIRQSIQFQLKIDAIELNLSHCIPLGLIMNEAITNSIKYAFPGNKEGFIYISFLKLSENHLTLVIKDNGVGLPSRFNVDNDGSMGMKLMKGLSEDIDGTFAIINNDGIQLSLDFMYTPDITTKAKEIKA